MIVTLTLAATALNITNVVFGGSGCPPNTGTWILQDPTGPLRFYPDAFIALVGPGTPLSKSRQFCQANIAVTIPADVQVAMQSASTYGESSLEVTSTSDHTTSIYLSGDSATDTQRHQVPNGAYHDDVTFDPSTTIWSQCGVTDVSFNAKTAVRVSGAGSDQVDIIDYALMTRPCNST